MDKHLVALLKELERFGTDNDAKVQDRRDKMLNITPDTGVFLSILVQAVKARHVLEIGTSNGYSTLWLAEAVQHLNGVVTTVEVLPSKVEMARANFARAGLSASIYIHLGDAGAFLRTERDSSYDFIFLDADRDQYVNWWPDLQRVLAPGGLIGMDNALSHAGEVAEFIATVCTVPGFLSVLVPLGSGEFLIYKRL